MSLENEHAKNIEAVVRGLLRWFSRGARNLPWRHTLDPYAIWVSEIMLQQTQVKTVIPYWERWMRELPDVQALAKAKPERVLKLWEGLGYYTRARNMQKAAQVVCENFRGKLPRNFEGVLDLPGIGRYTAGAICSIAYNQPTPVLDGNTIRVLSRIFCLRRNVNEKTMQRKLWGWAEELVQCASQHKGQLALRGKMLTAGNCSTLNQALMEMGATVCTARNPSCELCPLKGLCAGFATGRVKQLPNLGKRTQTTPRQFLAFALEHKGRFLIQQRPGGVVNAHLWEFPNIEVTGKRLKARPSFAKEWRQGNEKRKNKSSHKALQSFLQQFIPLPPLPCLRKNHAEAPLPIHLCTVKHTITRYWITLEAYRVRVESRPHYGERSARWVKPKQLNVYAFPSAHKHLVRALLKAGD